MERVKLRTARLRIGWTLERAAEHIGVGRNTLWRWELGMSDPYPYNVYLICQTYGKSAAELDLKSPDGSEDTHLEYVGRTRRGKHDADSETPIEVFHDYMRRDLELHLQCLVFDWLHHRKSTWTLANLQQRLSQEVESYDQMNEQDYLNHKNADQGRRDALRRIALLPLQALGLGIVGTTLSWASEDILTHCAAGITACEHLANGLHEDMTLAFATLSAYLPTLKAIVQDSLLHRKQAARLTGQAFFLKSLLSLHFEGPQQAALYAEQGINYSKESGSLPLQLILLRRIAWIYACDRQNEKAVEKMLEAQYLLEHASDPLPAFVQSYIYSGVADNQGRHGQMDEALLALRRAHETFSASSSNDLSLDSMMPYDLAHLLLADGLTHYHLGQYDEALASFAQVIDLETLTPKIPVPAERVRFEIINYQALASLKRPEKDMELSTKLWNAGLQGAKALHSEQRLNEALSAYDIMQALWPTEKRISDLRERLRRW